LPQGARHPAGRNGKASAHQDAQEDAFVAEYLKDFNGADAVRRWKPDAKRPDVIASKWLKKPSVQAKLAKQKNRLCDRYEITADRIYEELAYLAFGRITDFFRTTSEGDPVVDLSEMDEKKGAAISEITVDDYVDGRGEGKRDVKRIKLRMHDKHAALVTLAKAKGIYQDGRVRGGESDDPNAPEVTVGGGLPEDE
jgi:phage terminase small subunit